MSDSYLAELVDGRVRDLFGDAWKELPAQVDAADGSIVAVREGASGPSVEAVIAPGGGALASMYALAARHRLDPRFPEAVTREVERVLAKPGTDDPAITDLTSVPFVTVDGPGTRDLDQALFVTRADGGFRVDYAIADAAYYVQPGTALFTEALRRGASYYLPGLSIPMLPRTLSEGIVSLNAGVVRRALVLRMHLDAEGRVQHTEVVRARLESRAKLTFDDVDRFLQNDDAPEPAPGAGESLRTMRIVGELRRRDAERRDVPRYFRHERDLTIDESGLRFTVGDARRSPVEGYNEQLSLLCNIEGARLLLEGDRVDDDIQPIYRVHPRPDAERMQELEKFLAAIATHHRLDGPEWRWRREQGQSLAQFLAGLPEHGRHARIAAAMHRQAVMSNLRSTYSEEPSRHHGVGAEVYARFSSPMREIVGVFVHKELLEKLGLDEARDRTADETLAARVVERGGEARQLQKRLTKEAMRIALDQLFAEDDRLRRDTRPLRSGTLMALTRGKLHVLLDDPGVEVKIYTRHLERQLRTRVDTSPDGIALVDAHGKTLWRLGDAVNVQLVGRDRKDDRWKLSLIKANG
ncbi:MAG TPA: RNB domain-containing ribonuclease [Polyangiaceae bacterium]|nr:RNB domain-containing ribonuclease [Polyangiaceae bacterium]